MIRAVGIADIGGDSARLTGLTLLMKHRGPGATEGIHHDRSGGGWAGVLNDPGIGHEETGYIGPVFIDLRSTGLAAKALVTSPPPRKRP